jgi:two-component system chemotaxis response regulator CheB
MGPVGRVVGMGASAGGVDALVRVVAGLPAGLPHAVCVTLHVPSSGESSLAKILDRSCSLPVRAASSGEPLRAGHVYVAPPDQHLVVTRDRVELTRGPKENGVRPAVDTMLRSIADAHGDHGIAVVLSGALGDGSDGARLVLAAGGDVIVQDPEDAIVRSMPERTLALVDGAARVLAAAEIGPAVASLDGAASGNDARVAAHREPHPAARPAGPPTGFSCPDCGGPLWDVHRGGVTRFRCRVGHEYSEDAMVAAQGSAVERAMYAALETLEERAELLRRVADGRPAEQEAIRRSFLREAEDADARAKLIRRALASGEGEAELPLPRG